METMREACFDPPADVFTILQGWSKFKGTSKYSHLLKLLKGAYGLKDAPKLWKKRLEQFCEKHGGKQSMLDSCVWMWFNEQGLVGMFTTHIDDLKGCGD